LENDDNSDGRDLYNIMQENYSDVSSLKTDEEEEFLKEIIKEGIDLSKDLNRIKNKKQIKNQKQIILESI